MLHEMQQSLAERTQLQEEVEEDMRQTEHWHQVSLEELEEEQGHQLARCQEKLERSEAKTEDSIAR